MGQVGEFLPWQEAWERALYDGSLGEGSLENGGAPRPRGFFRREAPADHFRTATHGSDLMARAVVALARRHALPAVVDVGAGRGELLVSVRALAPDLALHGVERVPRPTTLPEDVAWSSDPPAHVHGLLLAHEWLDVVPCPVVEVDAAGTPRFVLTCPATGEETLGAPVAEGPAEAGSWLAQWWPVDGARPGTRAEVGLPRDRAWAGAVDLLDRGVALAVDYGHTREARPAGGSLRSFRRGRQVAVVPDGTRDVTAGVAVDAVADAVGGRVLSQREALRALGVVQPLPPTAYAESRPRDYLEALGRASSDAELVDPGSFGGFAWIVSGRGCAVSLP